ncbi:MAG: DUF3592 domain-containing protein [Oscillospiraceae bacterium]|nr:DUF3592 domain-containing protein [Oscillospiraceae bacterium]
MVFLMIFGVLFILFLITGIYTLVCGLRIKHYEGRTEGKVVELQHFGSYRDKSRNHNYRPVFRYTVDGTEYTRPFDVMSKDKERFQVGEEIMLCYDLQKPEHFAPEGDTSMVMSSLPYLGGAVLCAGLVLFILL